MPIPKELLPRQAGGTIGNVQHTLSSWDNCMAQSYCKWPVIVVIVIGSLIVLSLIICLARCLCCGLECCCGCLSCCNACCPSPRRRRDRSGPDGGASKFADHDHDHAHSPHPGFQPAPYYGGYQPAPQPPTYASPAAPQYAHFDNHNNTRGAPVHADSLPHMPSWDTAAERQVPEAHEMDKMGHGPEEHGLLAHQAPDPHVEPPYGDAAAGGVYRGQQVTGGSRSTTPLGGQQARYGSPPSQAHEAPPYESGRESVPSSLAVGSTGGYSGSTRYEPTSYSGGQETGTAYAAYNQNRQQHSWRDV